MKRREFIKLSAAGCAALGAMELQGRGLFRPAVSLGATEGAAQCLTGSLGAKEVTSVCEMCFWRCPIVGKIKDGKLVKIEGNPKSPANGPRVCARGNSGSQLIYDPDRMKYPMKRVGARGEGKWAKISWDEALDEIVHNMQKVKKEYGPNAIAYFDHGASAEFMREKFKATGTENYTNEPAFFQCVGPVAIAYLNTAGYLVSGTRQYIDMGNAKAILLVGSHIGENVHVSHVREFIAGLNKGAKLIVVDPRFSAPADKADIYLPIRPGTDTALLLSWINYVIQKNLYDKAFVKDHCNGFEKLRESVKPYTIEWAAKICDLNPKDMKRAIELLAKDRPNVAIHPGRHSTWYGKDDVGRHHALAILNGLMGAVAVPGGIYFPTPVKPGKAKGMEVEVEETTPAISLKTEYPYAEALGTPTANIIKATLTGKPYPVKFWGINGVNILQTIPNPYDTMEAIKKLDFIFSSEMLAGETAIWSDIILPDATYLERYDAIHTYDGLTPYLTVRQPVVEAMFETKSPYWVAHQLAKKMNVDVFPYEKEQDYLNMQLQPLNLSLEKLNAQGGIIAYPAKPYRDRKDLKLPTESGKYELYVEDFAKNKLDPLPKFIPVTAPPKGYMRLVYGRVPMHTFSRTMNNLWLNNEMPENELWVNDSVAAKIGIKDGDTVIMENQDGKKSNPVKVKVTAGMRPDAAYLPHGFGSKSPLLTKTYKKGASDQFMITRYENDPYVGSSSHRTSFIRLIKDGKTLDIPEIRPLPPEIPRFEIKKTA